MSQDAIPDARIQLRTAVSLTITFHEIPTISIHGQMGVVTPASAKQQLKDTKM